MFSGIGGSEILVILLAILLLFGSKRIPGFARALGKGMAEFRKAMREIKQEVESTALDERQRDKEPPAG